MSIYSLYITTRGRSKTLASYNFEVEDLAICWPAITAAPGKKAFLVVLTESG